MLDGVKDSIYYHYIDKGDEMPTSAAKELDRATEHGVSVGEDYMTRRGLTIFYVVKSDSGFWLTRDKGSRLWDVRERDEHTWGDIVHEGVARGEAMKYAIDKLLLDR